MKKASAPSIWTALIAVYIFWGSTYLAIRFAVDTIPPFLMAGTRFLVAGIIMYVWRRAAGDRRPTRLEWRSTAIVGLLLLTFANGTVSWAEQTVPSGIAALLVGTVPLWMVLIEGLRPHGTPLTRRAILGVSLGFVGVIVLVGPVKSYGGQPLNLVGAGLIVFAAILWAIGSVYSRSAPMPESSLLGTGMEMLVAGSGLLILGTLAGQWQQLNLSAVTTQSWLGLLYLIVCGSLIGYTAYTWLLRSASISLASTFAYVNPLIAVILGSLLGQEPLTPRIALAALVIIGAVVLISTTRAPRRKLEPAYAVVGKEE